MANQTGIPLPASSGASTIASGAARSVRRLTVADGDFRAALAAILAPPGGGGAAAGAADVPEFLRDLESRGARLMCAFTLDAGSGSAGAAAVVESPGASAFVLLPSNWPANAPQEAARALLEAARAAVEVRSASAPQPAAARDVTSTLGGGPAGPVAGQGPVRQDGSAPAPIRLLQVLAPPDELWLGRAIKLAGFRFLTQLIYLEADAACLAGRASRPRPDAPPGPALDWRRFDPDTADRFVEALEASFVDTQDCPGLEGLRSTAEILDGHRAAGDSLDRHWWLATAAGVPAGLVLLARHRGGKAMEIAYLGVAAGQRRRGVGDALVRRAAAEARSAGVSRLTLAVDRANGPARRLYQAWGFLPIARRDAWIAAFGAARR